MHLVFRKGVPYRHKIDEILSRLIECGLVEFWLKSFLEDSVRKNENEEKSVKEFIDRSHFILDNTQVFT